MALLSSGLSGVDEEGLWRLIKTPFSDEKPKEEKKEQTEAYYTSDTGSVTKVDAQTHEVVDTIAIDGSAHNVQISPDEKVIGVTIVPSEGHAEDSSGSNESMEMEHDEDSDTSMSNESDDEKGIAAFYDTETGEKLAEVEVGSHPAHIVFTNDGNYAAVSNIRNNSMRHWKTSGICTHSLNDNNQRTLISSQMTSYQCNRDSLPFFRQFSGRMRYYERIQDYGPVLYSKITVS